MIKSITNFILFQIAWFAAIIGGASGWPLMGSVPALVVVAIHLVLNRNQLSREAVLIVGVTLLGVIVETCFVSLRALHYVGTSTDAVLPPIWIIALWFAFGTLPHGSLSWLSKRVWVQAFLGAVFGPLSYVGGVKLGAATMPVPMMGSIIIISVGWALAMVLMFQMADRLDRDKALNLGLEEAQIYLESFECLIPIPLPSPLCLII